MIALDDAHRMRVIGTGDFGWSNEIDAPAG
jgi:hypothetical protein